MTKKEILIALGLYVLFCVLFCFLPNYLAYKPRSPRAACRYNLLTVQTWEQSYFEKHHVLTASLEELGAPVWSGTHLEIQLLASGADAFTATCASEDERASISSEPRVIEGREVPAYVLWSSSQN